MRKQLVSVEKSLHALRKQRYAAVQTLDQYCFLHLLLIELILIFDTKVDKKRIKALKRKYLQILKQAVTPEIETSATKPETSPVPKTGNSTARSKNKTGVKAGKVNSPKPRTT
uniref:Tyrosine-protein phosphatase domain-containing protein n=1 Tax=Panagrolaimus sp. ES5 TaxID=591445 RepID=A0AC34F7X6_9BILA